MASYTKYSATKRFFSLLKLDKKELFYLYFFALWGGIIGLTLPLGIQTIINYVASGEIASSWWVLIALVTLGIAFAGFLKIMQLQIIESLQQKIFLRSAFDFAYRIPHIKSEALHKQYAPELMNRFFDTLTLQKGLAKILLDFSASSLDIIMGLLVVSFYHSSFAIFALLLLLCLILIFIFTTPNGLKSSLKESSYKYEVAYWLEELARVATTMKFAGETPLPLGRTDEHVKQYLYYRKKHFNILFSQYTVFVLFKTLVAGGLLVVGSILVVDNQINIGQFIGAEIVVLSVMSAIEKLMLSMESIYDVLTALEKLGVVTDLPLDRKGGVKFTDVLAQEKGGVSVKVKELSYKYPNEENLTLDNISFEIAQGKSLCIAGYGDSGKTTLLRILSGELDSYSGILLFNNIPLKSIDLNDFHHIVGNISANDDIFKGSFYDNISLKTQGVDLKEIIHISEQIGLAEYIEKLPQGYDTELISGGLNIPKSIRRKVLVARSLIGNPPIIMTEAALQDLLPTEKEIIRKVLTDNHANRTLVFSSNDKYIAQECDEIIILENGKIIDRGDYATISQLSYFNDLFL